jgi:hypothetical protein
MPFLIVFKPKSKGVLFMRYISPLEYLIVGDGHFSEKINLHCGHLSDTISIDPKIYVDNWATLTSTCTHL